MAKKDTPEVQEAPAVVWERDRTLNLYQRLNLVMQEVDYVRKEDKKVNDQYRFATHDAVTAAVRRPMTKYGIVAPVNVINHIQDGNRTIVDLEVTFINVDNPEDKLTITAFGYGLDGQDKGVGKAISYAVKYALLKTFALETGDDPDNDVKTDYKPPKAAPATPAPPEKPPVMDAPTDEPKERKALLTEMASLIKATATDPEKIRAFAGGRSSAELTNDELKKIVAMLRQKAKLTPEPPVTQPDTQRGLAQIYKDLSAIQKAGKWSNNEIMDFAESLGLKRDLNQCTAPELDMLLRNMEKQNAEGRANGAA